MSRGVSAVLGVALLAVVPLLIWGWLHNSLVSSEEATYSAWAQVESNYQRRSDLIPGLVETVSRYLRHEADTLTKVTHERGAPVTALSKAIDDLVTAQSTSAQQLRSLGGRPPTDDAALETLAQYQDQVGRGISQVLAIAESYPTLRSADQFLELQAQLEGTENRINVARMAFNEAVRDYNGAIRKMPSNLVAGVGGFARKAYFKSDEGARHAGSLRLD